MQGSKSTAISRRLARAQHLVGFDEQVVSGNASDTPRSEFGTVLNASLFAQEGLHAQWRRCLSVNAHERLALMHLWKSGPMTMSELGDRIPLSRAAITTLTDRLERMEYLKRTEDPSDRRRTVLVLTDRPAKVLGPLWAEYLDEFAPFVEGMSDEQWAWTLELIRKVEQVSEAHADRLRALDDEELSQIVDVADRSARRRA